MKDKKQNKKTNSERKNTVFFIILGIALVLGGLYGLFVSLTGGAEYINSQDKRTVIATVTGVKHTFDRDDDGNVSGEKWKATLRYTVDGNEYTAKKTFSTETYNGETVQLEVYKVSTGEYKVSEPNVLGFIISAAVLLFGTVILVEENKDRKKKKLQKTKAKIKKNIKTSEKIEGGSQDGTV